MKKLILLALLLCITIGQCSLYANDSEPDFWEVFTAQNSGLPNNLVFRIAADHSGRIWMASNGLTLYDHGTWSNFGKTILQIAVDGDNNAWCASDLFGGQLTKCDGNSIVSYNTTTSPGIPSDWVSGVTVDNNNIVWVACSFTGVGEFDGQKWTKHLDPSIGSGNHPMVCDHNNTIWLGTSVGLYRYVEQAWSQFTAEDCGVLADQISALACDKNGTIWVATVTKGLARFDGSNWTTYTTTTSGLPSDTLRSLAIDSSGVLWVGTQSGLASYDGTTWSTKTTDNWVLPGNIVMGIAVSPDNDLWFATNAGLLHTSQVLTSVGETNQSGQAALSLTPNPCFGQSTAHLSLQSTAHVRLALYTATGEKAVDIISQLLPAGDHTFSIEGTHLASGVYYCLVTVNGIVEAHKKLVIQH